MKKRCLATLLALVMCLTLLPATASAAEDDFVIDAEGVLIKYTGSGGEVIIPEGVTGIDEGAFYGCTGLTGVTISGDVTSIGSYAFHGCTSLTSVTIPEGVTSIGDGVFEGCDNLTAFQVDANNPNYTALDGVLFSKGRETLLAYPGGRQGAYVIPDGVTSVGDRAFKDCTGLTGVTIPEGVASIGRYAFNFCSSLTDMAIPGNVTDIGEYAFQCCAALTNVTIPEGITTIERGTFQSCENLTVVTIPASVTVIGEAAFYRCSNLTVYGTEGSRAEQYCMANDISFVVGVAPGTAQKGTLESIGGQCVTWDITSRGEVSMTLPGATEAEEAILVVCYDTSGRFTGVKWVTAQSPSTRIDPATPNVRLFWLGAEGVPQSNSVTVWGKYTE